MAGPTTTFTIPVLRYMKEYGLTHEQLAYVAVAQRRWAAKNPRAMFRDPITVDDVLASRIVAYPFHLLECCLVTDGGGALIVTSADRAGDFPKPPVHVLGTGEASETPMISQMEDFTESQAIRLAGAAAFAEAGIGAADVGHLMIYDAFAHLPIYGLEALGFVAKGEAGPFIAEGNTEPGGRLPLNTNGGGLSYTHTGHVRHVRHPGRRPPGARRSGRSGRGPGDQRGGRQRRHVRHLGRPRPGEAAPLAAPARRPGRPGTWPAPRAGRALRALGPGVSAGRGGG